MSDMLQRVSKDIDRSERSLRQNAERMLAQYQAILRDLAFRFAGQTLEEKRKETPGVPNNWTPEEWSEFWKDVQPNTIKLSSGWGRPLADDAEIISLVNKLKETEEKLENKTRELDSVHKQRNTLQNSEKTQEKNIEKPERELKPEIILSDIHETIKAELKNLVIPKKPLRFKKRLFSDNIRYRRQIFFLYILAHQGIAPKIEIDFLVTTLERITAKAGSFRRILSESQENGLVNMKTLRLQDSFNTSLILVRLSEDGKELCQSLGWEPVDSEWQRLIDLHQGERDQKHTLAVLIFAMHARLRGWQTTILPEIAGSPSVPDVCVSKGEQKIFVEVERGDGSKNKWENLASLGDGQIGICAVTEEKRRRLVDDCKLLKIKGCATDLKSLIFESKDKPRPMAEINQRDDLWIEEW
ncbi:MAG: hypothetical protein JEZ06_08875 [Anaerolineaceae bacterium]|nr:hypothetical protein [Anaerolineaceae bacterium]